METAMNRMRRSDPFSSGSERDFKRCSIEIDGNTATGGLPGGTSISDAMKSGLAHHHAGRLGPAETLYLQVLQVSPTHPDALHLLGMIAYQRGRSDIAVELLNDAIRAKPTDAEFCHDLGIVLAAQGKLEDALACFRKAISLVPDYADAHFNLGTVLQAQRKLDEAIASYGSALSFDPGLAAAHNNLGTLFQQQGKLSESIESYRKALLLEPNSSDSHYNLGNALKDQGDAAAAVASYRKALENRPDHVQAHNNLASVFASQGMLDDAAESYRRALYLRPDFAEAHNNLGSVEMRRGNLNEAGANFLSAVSIKPAFAEAHNNLGNVLYALERFDAAIASFRRALELDEAPEFKASFVRCVRNANLIPVDTDVRRLVTRALSEPWARPSDLASASVKLISMDAEIKACIECASRAWPTRLTRHDLFGSRGLQALANDPLLQALLENAQVCDLPFERLLTSVRRVVLDDAFETDAGGDPDDGTLTFYCAIARQCFLNEFVYSCSVDELDRVHRLQERIVAALESETVVPAMWVAAVAAYCPLLSLARAEDLLRRSWPECVSAVLTQQITESLDEQNYRTDMRRLTPVEDSLSRRVQQQYEENPYPRWMKLPPAGRTRSLDLYLREQFPAMQLHSPAEDGDLDILIAGCGTGQESIEMAQQFPAARVLAVDLSLSSLAYAKGKTKRLGISNLEYAQGDITKLGSIGCTFDLISSVGVLHHLEDPMVGCRQLVSLLRPGGYMRLGLYSERARQNITAARELIVEERYGSDAKDIRRCREALTSGENARKFAKVTSFRDFYATSEVRDMLFHVREHRFTLLRIQEMLAELRLDLVGFLLEPHIVNKYKMRYPDDRAKTHLKHWAAFEAEFPDTFTGMYVFWARKPAEHSLERTAS
jgi:tetratricopeptide (TPR) repeat protein/SAM-dependent methyltransferase